MAAVNNEIKLLASKTANRKFNKSQGRSDADYFEKQTFTDIRLRPGIATPFMAVAALAASTFWRRADYGQT